MYENATDEEKTEMMLQIAKQANAEQKAMVDALQVINQET